MSDPKTFKTIPLGLMPPAPTRIGEVLDLKDEQITELATYAVRFWIEARNDDPSAAVLLAEVNSPDWAPLENDGQAARLAALCNLNLRHVNYLSPLHSVQAGIDGHWMVDIPVKGNIFAAVRRAIVELAAQAGLGRYAMDQKIEPQG